MAPSARIDWSSVRAAYVQGTALDIDGDPKHRTWPTLDEVAALHGISAPGVRRRASREHWTEQRAAYQSELERERRRALVESRVAQATKVDSQGLTVAEAGMALVGVRLTHLVNRESAPGSTRGSTVDASELAALGLAARRWLQVKAAVMGQPADLEPSADEVEREFQVAEAMAAARLAEHLAARARDTDDVDEPVSA